jgi:serine/threonine-protein kinase HipA
MIRVWTDARRAGVLDRLRDQTGSTFAYDPRAPAERAVSVTMPVRVQSWDVRHGLAPIFEMNLPEGALRERLTRRFAKATGTFDDFDLLGVIGRSQIGRLRYSGLDEDIAEDVPLQSIDEILRAKRDGGLFDFLLDRFATHSGLSGVQPKFMIRASGKLSEAQARVSPTIQSATHIVKLWEADEYPELAANENFCLRAARQLGLPVPAFELSDDGGALVIERFDHADGVYLGFEDFCVLNGLPTRDKYDGSYETRLFKRLQDYIPRHEDHQSHIDLYRLFVLNCALRNGDAHLKNFGITYATVDGAAKLAPVYDIITTTAYIPQDPMALTLEGSTKWPDRKRLTRLGQTRVDLSPSQIDAALEATGDAMAAIAGDVKRYFADSEFSHVGDRMLAAWETGIRDSLGLVRGLSAGTKLESRRRPMARSDSVVLEGLRDAKGTLVGTHRVLAEQLGIPASTFADAVKRLAGKGMVEVGRHRLTLLQREV